MEEESGHLKRFFHRQLSPFSSSFARVDWKELRSSVTKVTLGGMVIGGLLGSIHKKGASGALSAGLYGFIASFSYLCNMQLVEEDRLAGVDSRNGYAFIAGLQSGAILAVITHDSKVPDPMKAFLIKTMAGGLVALALCFAQARYFDWRDRRIEYQRQLSEEKSRLFALDQQRHGEGSEPIRHYNLLSRRGSWIPEWFPIRPLPEDEYEERMANSGRPRPTAKPNPTASENSS